MNKVVFVLMAIGLLSTMSCEKLKELASFEVDNDFVINIDLNREAGAYSVVSNGLTLGLEASLDDIGLKPSDAEATLEKVTLTIETPDGASFSKFESIKFGVSSNGTVETIGEKMNISADAGAVLALDIDSSIDLIDALSTDPTHFVISCVTREKTDETYLIKVNFSLKVKKS